MMKFGRRRTRLCHNERLNESDVFYLSSRNENFSLWDFPTRCFFSTPLRCGLGLDDCDVLVTSEVSS